MFEINTYWLESRSHVLQYRLCKINDGVCKPSCTCLAQHHVCIMLFQGIAIVFVLDLLLLECCSQDCDLPNQWNPRQHAWANLFFLSFCGWFGVFWCSGRFGELTAIGCLTHMQLRTSSREIQLCLGHWWLSHAEKESGFIELPAAEWSWMHGLCKCSLGVKEEKTFWT